MNNLIDRKETISAWCLMNCGCKPDECSMTLEENGAEECEFVEFLLRRPEYGCTQCFGKR